MGQTDEPNRPKIFVAEEFHDIELFWFMNSGISDFLRNSYAFLKGSVRFFEWFLVFQYGRIAVELKSMILPENE